MSTRLPAVLPAGDFPAGVPAATTEAVAASMAEARPVVAVVAMWQAVAVAALAGTANTRTSAAHLPISPRKKGPPKVVPPKKLLPKLVPPNWLVPPN